LDSELVVATINCRMIKINENTRRLKIPRVDRCKTNSCDEYNAVLKNTATKEIIVYKLKDYNIKSQSYFYFDFYVPEWLETGTYEFYLTYNYDFFKEHIDSDNIYGSERHVKKAVNILENMIMVEGDSIIVSPEFSARIVDMGHEITTQGCSLLSLVDSDDQSEGGNLYRKIDIIQVDILYYPCKDKCFVYNDSDCSKKEYTMYKK